ncbi:unnamed protein product [Blepharisma stoltei]|uniref:Uncharacterized protein n=1 Tax=Blepharisma stoltei TaxID=1481888 RepID=A0AAU9K486_9CILI|nr:unnamed protein product [Blepharisma stoltei]
MSSNSHRLLRSKTPEVSIMKGKWDERFYLGKIPVMPLSRFPFKTRKSFHAPRYSNSSSQANSVSASRFQSRPSTSFRTSTPQRSTSQQRFTRNDTFRAISQKRFSYNDTFLTVKNKLEEFWDRKSIPEPLKQAFRECIFSLPSNKSIPIMSKEIEDLKSNNALVQIAIKSVEDRERLLNQVKDLVKAFNMSKEYETIKDLQLEAAETLQTYRNISLNVVENIARWREHLAYAQLIGISKEAIHPRIVQFIWEGENYLIKMRNDISFVNKTVLAAFFKFDNNPDTFLVVPSRVTGQKKPSELKKEEYYFKKSGDLIIPLPSILLKRIRIAEMLIMEEIFNEHRLSSGVTKPENSVIIEYRSVDNIKREDLSPDISENESILAKAIERERMSSDIVEKEANPVEKEIIPAKDVEEEISPIKNSDKEILFDEMIEEDIISDHNTLTKAMPIQIEDKPSDNIEKEIKFEESPKQRAYKFEINMNLFDALNKNIIKSIKENSTNDIQKSIIWDEISNEIISEQISKFSFEISNDLYEQANLAGIVFGDLLYEAAEKMCKSILNNEIKLERENEHRNQALIKKIADDENMKVADLIYTSLIISLASEISQQEIIDEIEYIRTLNDEEIENNKLSYSLFSDLISHLVENLTDKFILDEIESYEKEKLLISDMIFMEFMNDLTIDIANKEISKEEFRLKKIKEKKIISEIAAGLFPEFLYSLAQEIVLEQIIVERKRLQDIAEIKEIENIRICEMLINDWIAKLVEEISKKEINDHKQNLIKVEQNEKIIKSKIDKKVSKRILAGIINECIKQNFNIRKLSEEWLLEEIESSSQASSVQDIGSDTYKSDAKLKEELMLSSAGSSKYKNDDYPPLNFATENNFRGLQNFDIARIKIPENFLETYIQDYYRFLPELFNYFVPPVNLLLYEEIIKGIDPNILWINKESTILGLLVCSFDSDYSRSRRLNIYHISCLNANYFKIILGGVLDYLWEEHPCDEIRLHVYNERNQKFEGIPKELKDCLTYFQFRYKAQIPNSIGNASVMGKYRPPGVSCKLINLKQTDKGVKNEILMDFTTEKTNIDKFDKLAFLKI